jgi:hypothetical protein
VYAGELMPTVVRSEAMGISSFVAGLGLLMFPYVNALVNAKVVDDQLEVFHEAHSSIHGLLRLLK